MVPCEIHRLNVCEIIVFPELVISVGKNSPPDAVIVCVHARGVFCEQRHLELPGLTGLALAEKILQVIRVVAESDA